MAYLTDDQLREAIASYQGGMASPAPMQAPTMPEWGAMGARPAPTPDVWAVPPGANIPLAPDALPAPAPVPQAQPQPAPQVAARPARPMDPYQQAMADTERLSAQRADAAKGVAEARARSGVRSSKLLERQQGAVGASLARQQARQRGYEETRDQGMAEYKRMADQAANMSAYDRRSRGEKAMAALAVGIGTMADGLAQAGATYAGGSSNTNYAEQIDRAIQIGVERDLDEQREAIANLKDRAGAKLTELGIARDYFQDDTAAEEWTRQTIREHYGLALQEEAATLESETARFQGIEAGAAIAQDAADRKLQIADMREQRRLQRAAQARSGAAKGPDWGGLTREQLEQLAAAGRLPADGQLVLDKLRGGDPKPEKPADTRAQINGYVQTQDVAPGDASTAKKVAGAASSLRADFARLSEIRAKNGGGTTLNRNDVNEAKRIIGGMAPKFSQMYGAGAPSTTELELFMETLVDPTDYQLTGLDPIEAYARAVDQITRVEQEQLNVYGYQPAGQQSAEAAPVGGGRRGAMRADDPMRHLKSNFGFRPKGK